MDPTINKRAAEALIPIINGALGLQRCGQLRPGTLVSVELPSNAWIELIEAFKTPMVEDGELGQNGLAIGRRGR